MFLSFIIPVYNTEKYLPECLDSLLEQNIPSEEYEIICVNDGSTDNSLAILHMYQEQHPNIMVIDKENGGVATARNAGMDAARGDYIWFVDSDDFICANILKKLFEVLAAENYDRLIVGVYTFNSVLSQEEKNLIDNNCLRVNSHYYDSIACDSLLRKEFLIEHCCGFHYPDITHGEDSIFMYEFMSYSPKCKTIDVPVYFYRQRPGSAMTSNSTADCERKLHSYLNAAEIMKRHYEKGSTIQRDAANLLMSFLWLTLQYISILPIKHGIAERKKLKQNGLYPYKRPEECTLRKSYQTTRTDFFGKLFDCLYINMHRPWGFWAMVILQRLISLKRRVAKMR